MGKPHPKMVAVGSDEHLGLVSQAPEGGRVDDPVAVALEDVPRAAGAAIGFLMGPAARLAWPLGAGREGHQVLSFSIRIWAGVRVQLKPSTPSFSSLLTKAWASDLLGNGPTRRRK